MILLAKQILDNKEYLSKCGVKGQNLANLKNKNINVPDFFVIPSETCQFYLDNGILPSDLRLKIENSNLAKNIKNNCFLRNDLTAVLNTVSVRSSGVISMPGIMHTYLNVGLIKNDFDMITSTTKHESVTEGFIINDSRLKLSRNSNIDKKPSQKFIRYKFLMHYIQNLIFVYKSLDHKVFPSTKQSPNLKAYEANKSIIEDMNTLKNTDTILDSSIDPQKLIHIKNILEDIIQAAFINGKLKYNVIHDPLDQILFFIEKVFDSSQSLNVNLYKNSNKLKSNINTAVIVQQMVYGDINGLSGVCFSRNPITGDNTLYAEVVFNSQGNDLVSGIKTPMKLDSKHFYAKELQLISKKLEKHYKYPQDIEFTVFEGKVYIMQTRNAKLTVNAQLRIGMDMYKEKIISLESLIKILQSINVNNCLYAVTKNYKNNIIAEGIPSNPGAIKAKIAITDEYIENNSEKYDLCLVRNYTSVDDYCFMTKCKAFITKIGGSTSHASVIARSLNKPAICGVTDLEIYANNHGITKQDNDLNENRPYIKLKDKIFYNGDEIVVDGTNGYVLTADTEIINNTENIGLLNEILQLIGSNSTQVSLNADTEEEIESILDLNVTRIGLCRTEHMLVDPNMLKIFRKYIVTSLILKKNPKLVEFYSLKAYYLNNLIQIQTDKFIKILKFKLFAAIRLFDPPLHEFFQIERIDELAAAIKEDLFFASKGIHNSDGSVNIKLDTSHIDDIDLTNTNPKFDIDTRENTIETSYRQNDERQDIDKIISHNCLEVKNANSFSDKNHDITNLVRQIIINIQEINPMLGNRGSRLGIDLPELYKMQVISLSKALIEIYPNKTDFQTISKTTSKLNTSDINQELSEIITAKTSSYKINNPITAEVNKNTKESLSMAHKIALVGITIPFINDLKEFLFLRNLVTEITTQYGVNHIVEIGVMIETVRACFISDELARHSDYFSFGTNDLTQVALSISRDDIQKIPTQYYDFWQLDPFQSLDVCVQDLMKISINKAREANPKIKFSVCGEHARFKENIAFFKAVGIQELSVSKSAILTTKYNISISD